MSCKPRVPSKYIQPGDMEDILYDFHIAQAMSENIDRDEQKHAFQQTLYFAAVLEKHGVTKADFDSSLVYYYIRADRFADIYKRVAKRLSDEALDLGASEGEVIHYAKTSESGDTTDIWKGELSMMLIPFAPYNRYDFTQKPDTSFRPGDSFMFMVNSEFIMQNGYRNAQAVLTLHYDNDTIVSKAITISSSGVSQLNLPEVEKRKVKEIRGYIFMPTDKEKSTTLKMLAIKNIRLIKFRKQPTDSLKTKTL